MTADERGRRKASPQEAAAVLGAIALGCSYAVTSSVAEAVGGGVAAAVAVYVMGRWQRRRGGGSG